MESFWRTPTDKSFGSFGGIWVDESSDWKASLQVNMCLIPGGFWDQAFFLGNFLENFVHSVN
jgi:hypothetical protein